MKQEPNTPERIERIKEVYVDGDEKLVLPFSFAVLLDNMRCSINFLLDGWRRHCEECYTSPDSFSDKICIDAQCSCHTPTSPVGEKRCGDCEWLKKNLQPRNDVYEKCANGHTFPKHTPASHADGKKCGCACHKRKEPSPNLAGWEKIKDEVEGIIHAYAVNHYNAPEGDWVERRRVRNLALQDLANIFSSLLSLHTKKLKERVEGKKVNRYPQAHPAWNEGFQAGLSAAVDVIDGNDGREAKAKSDVLSEIDEAYE